jgi:3-oxoacyl-[acyl-carrier protein] reductase
METTLLLTGKNAVIFGASGDVGTAVAKEFAAQGATVYLAGRRLGRVEELATAIQKDGGSAYAASVDALDEKAVQAYLERVVKEAKSIDILFNLTGPRPNEYGNAINTLELPIEQFTVPFTTLVPSQFITARSAARHMVQQHSGVILFLMATLSRGFANSTSIGSAFGALESLLRCLATDLGPAGVRVIGVSCAGMPDTKTIKESVEIAAQAFSMPPEQFMAILEDKTLLKRLANTTDIARLAAFLASDVARNMTGAIVNASSGSALD